MNIELIEEVRKAFNGDAWHGNNLMQQLHQTDAERAFLHLIPNAHSIAEIVLHLTAWTEEVVSRLQGGLAKDPQRGDWPVPVDHTAAGWQRIVADCRLANERLIRVCAELSAADWVKVCGDERDRALGSGVTYAELLNGLIQHHAYHSGQIGLLLKV